MGVFVRELAALYEAYVAGRPSPLQELPLQYADFAAWQRGWLQGDVLEEQLSYWKRQLADASPLLELPTDRPRPPVQSFHGQKQSAVIPRRLTDAIVALMAGVDSIKALASSNRGNVGRFRRDSTLVPKIRGILAELDSLRALASNPVGTIGRAPNNDVSLPTDEYASSRHARIEARRDGVWISDVGSTNGTFVNGIRLTRERRLAQGDQVRIGETDLKFDP